MSVVKIDGKDYELESLSEKARIQINNLQVVERRLADLREQMAIVQTARVGYTQALKAALDESAQEAAVDTSPADAGSSPIGDPETSVQ